VQVVDEIAHADADVLQPQARVALVGNGQGRRSRLPRST
jgi:hypothetical protein